MILFDVLSIFSFVISEMVMIIGNENDIYQLSYKLPKNLNKTSAVEKLEKIRKISKLHRIIV